MCQLKYSEIYTNSVNLKLFLKLIWFFFLESYLPNNHKLFYYIDLLWVQLQPSENKSTRLDHSEATLGQSENLGALSSPQTVSWYGVSPLDVACTPNPIMHTLAPPPPVQQPGYTTALTSTLHKSWGFAAMQPVATSDRSQSSTINFFLILLTSCQWFNMIHGGN